jgi:hypothetical protein
MDGLLPNFPTSDTTHPITVSHRIAENLNLQRTRLSHLGSHKKICQQNLQPDVFEYEATNRAIIKQVWVSWPCFKSNWKSVQ